MFQSEFNCNIQTNTILTYLIILLQLDSEMNSTRFVVKVLQRITIQRIKLAALIIIQSGAIKIKLLVFYVS